MIFSLGIRTFELSGVVIWIGINSGDKLRNFLKTLERKTFQETFLKSFIIVSLENFFLVEECAILIVIELFMGKSYNLVSHRLTITFQLGLYKTILFNVQNLKGRVELTRKTFKPDEKGKLGSGE